MKSRHQAFLGSFFAIAVALVPTIARASVVGSMSSAATSSDGPTVNVIFGKVKDKVKKAFSHGGPQVQFHRGRILPTVQISKGDKARHAVHAMGIGQSTAKHGGKTSAHTPPGTPTIPPSTSLAHHQFLQKVDKDTTKPHTCPTCGGPAGAPKR